MCNTKKDCRVVVRLSSPTVVRQAHQPPDSDTVFIFTAFLPINKEPMEGRLSSPEICIANLRYPEKSRMDFSGSYARLEGWRSQTAGGGPERQRSPGKRVTKGASGRISQKVVW